jgi:hypothetical protein
MPVALSEPGKKSVAICYDIIISSIIVDTYYRFRFLPTGKMGPKEAGCKPDIGLASEATKS